MTKPGYCPLLLVMGLNGGETPLVKTKKPGFQLLHVNVPFKDMHTEGV